jgi:hypothetical protein
VATIATHNLNAMKPPLQYACSAAGDISFMPLNWTKSVSVQAFLRHLEASKQDKRGGGGGGRGGKGGAGKGKKGGHASAAAAAPVDPTSAALTK